MMIDDTANGWRDLTDQLTPQQVRQMEENEGHWDADYLLFEARDHAQTNLEDALMFGHLPEPEGAYFLDHWVERDGFWTREFGGPAHVVGNVFVRMTGTQSADGSETRGIQIDLSTDDRPMDADAVGQCIAVLIGLAAELRASSR